MKTAEAIQEELNELMIFKGAPETALERKAHKKARELRLCKMLISTNPREEYLKSELKRLTALYASIESQYPTWYQQNKHRIENVSEFTADAIKNPKQHYASLMETKSIKHHIKSIKYLLG